MNTRLNTRKRGAVFFRVLSYHPPSWSPLCLAKSSSSKNENRVRIIGGRWRGRKIAFPDGEGLRPTGDRIRETLFNWLMPVLPEARCLDLFAGSGALGFEALSRGAAHCVMLERNSYAARSLQATRQLLGADAISQVVAADALSWLQAATGCFDVVFIDPPFADAQLSPAVFVEQLQQRALLSDDPWIYVEQPANIPLSPPQGFMTYRQQRAGLVQYGLWRRAENIL